jgi:hypothetical protein
MCLEEAAEVLGLDVFVEVAHEEEALQRGVAHLELLVLDPQRVLGKVRLRLLRGVVRHADHDHIPPRRLHHQAVHLSELGKHRLQVLSRPNVGARVCVWCGVCVCVWRVSATSRHARASREKERKRERERGVRPW